MLLYTTYKYCSIKSHVLGLYYYLGILAVVIYTIVTLFVNKGYLKLDTSPQGSITLISDSLDTNLRLPVDHYCCQGKNCSVDCFLIDGKELAWPMDKDSVTISSFFKERKQTLRNAGDGAILENGEETKYFSKNPEAIDIKVEHSIHSYALQLTGTQRTMQGELVGRNSETIKRFDSLERADRVSLNDLIIASGMQSLDETSDSPNGNNRSFRRKGCLLVVTIVYNNIPQDILRPSSPLSYTYHVTRVPFTPYRVEETIHNEDYLQQNPSTRYGTPQSRLLRKRYGVHVKFTQSGRLGTFSLVDLLQCIATSISLLALVTTLGDIVALYLLPQSQYYRNVIYGMRDEDLVDHKNEVDGDPGKKKTN